MSTLTSAQKSARTRSMKKANVAYEEMIAPEYTKWVEALDQFAPIRDAYIAKLEAKRDEAIAEINRQYEEDYAIQMAQFNHMMKPTDDALELARENAWVIYGSAIVGKKSFDQVVA
jgi:esterase/lipase